MNAPEIVFIHSHTYVNTGCDYFHMCGVYTRPYHPEIWDGKSLKWIYIVWGRSGIPLPCTNKTSWPFNGEREEEEEEEQEKEILIIPQNDWIRRHPCEIEPISSESANFWVVYHVVLRKEY